MTDITNPIFHDEEKAREHLEKIRWPDGPICPHCGSVDRSTRLKGESTRPGLFQCNDCRGHYSVTVGSVMERSHIPLAKWVLAFHLMAASKKGVSAHQLHRMLGITYKSAWFMAHRIREAMAEPTPDPIGGEGKIIEADETYHGPVRKRGSRFKTGEGWTTKYSDMDHKQRIVALVERGGKVRSVHAEDLTQKTVREIIVRHASRLSHLMTDESNIYPAIGREFASHESVKHSVEEYVRGIVHSNTVEGVFSIFKRGMRGIYQHCGEQHLHRYLAEFDFRYNNRIALGIDDIQRAANAIKGAEGKRLMYGQPRKIAAA